MQLKNLGLMLHELQVILQSKGCKVTEISVTIYPREDGTVVDGEDPAYRKDVRLHDHPGRGRVAP
jgi:hypothetical protein